MRLPTIYTSPGERPKFNFLLTENYLSEFRTEVDKARVRQNLGIPDEYNLYWGNIKGNIANQTDIIELIRLKTLTTTNLSEQNKTDIASLNTSSISHGNAISTLNQSVTSIQNFINGISNIQLTLLDMKIDIALNATDISNLSSGNSGSGSSSIDLSLYATQAYVNSQGFLKSNDLSSYATEAWVTQQIQNALGADTLTDITITPGTLSVTVNAEPITISVTGTYSRSGQKSIDLSTITVTSSDSTVAKWTNNKVEIVGQGTATLTVSVGTVSKTLSITVSASSSGESSALQYIAFARDYQGAIAACGNSWTNTNINGTWTSSTIPCMECENGTQLALFIITTQTLISAIELGPLDLTKAKSTENVTIKGIPGYTIYRFPDGTSYEWIYPINSYGITVNAY